MKGDSDWGGIRLALVGFCRAFPEQQAWEALSP